MQPVFEMSDSRKSKRPLGYLALTAVVVAALWQLGVFASPTPEQRAAHDAQFGNITADAKKRTATDTAPKPTAAEEKARIQALISDDTEAKKCGVGSVVAPSMEYDLRAGPSEKANYVLNQKATDILHSAQFHSVDPSESVKIEGCHDDWKQIRIMDPDWLQDVVGWVPTTALRVIPTTDDGKRVYVDADISWDEDTAGYKAVLVTMINKIAHENHSCASIQTGSLALSSTKGSKTDPVFFVTCERLGSSIPFNVWFRPTDVHKDMSGS